LVVGDVIVSRISVGAVQRIKCKTAKMEQCEMHGYNISQLAGQQVPAVGVCCIVLKWALKNGGHRSVDAKPLFTSAHVEVVMAASVFTARSA